MFYSETIEPRYGDYNANGLLSPEAALVILENVAGRHAALVRDEVALQKIAWVLVEWRLEFARRPKPGEKLHVTTWARSKAPASIVFRGFLADDGRGGAFFRADSKFALVDLEKNRLTTIGAEFMEIYKPEERRVFDSDAPRLRPPKAFTLEQPVRLRRSDVDFNGHVHNTRYLDLALDALPEEVYRRDNLSSVRLVYRAPLRYGDEAVIRGAPAGAGYLFGIYAGERLCTISELK